MTATEQNFDATGTPQLNVINMAEKFRAYRMEAESTERKFKEAEIVIQHLREEINFSRNSEQNLRIQLSCAQDRLISQEKTLKDFLNVTVQQRQNEDISQKLDNKIEGIVEEISKIREESKKILNYASVELELLKKIEELESSLSEKTNENDLKKMEFQTLKKEKETMEAEFQQKVSHLEKELEKSVKKEAESLAHNRETLLYYKKQIEDYEQKIEHYEQERKGFLEDFAPPETTKCSQSFTMADSTVNINPEDRSPNCKKRRTTDQTHSNQYQHYSYPGKYKPQYRRGRPNSYHSRASTKPKPQLEFLTASQESSQPIKPVECGRKRRLFSTNCNHYID